MQVLFMGSFNVLVFIELIILAIYKIWVIKTYNSFSQSDFDSASDSEDAKTKFVSFLTFTFVLHSLEANFFIFFSTARQTSFFSNSKESIEFLLFSQQVIFYHRTVF